jgi:hypothetical protein
MKKPMNMDSVKFELEEIVFLRIDEESKGIVTGIIFRPTGIMYMVTWGISNEQHHYEGELTREKSFSEKPS